MNQTMDQTTITIRYRAVDGCGCTRRFKTISGARRFAQGRVGLHPEIATFGGYAVSADGIGRIEVRGAKLADLFGAEERAAPAAAPAASWEQLHELEESIGELAAEYRSECTLFGDAGPGAALRLRELRARAASMRAELERRDPPQQYAAEPDWSGDADIPF